MQDIASPTVKSPREMAARGSAGHGYRTRVLGRDPGAPAVLRKRLPYHVTGASAARLPASHARAVANQRRAGVQGGASAGATAHAPCPSRARSLPRGRVEGGGGGGGESDRSRELGGERQVSTTAGARGGGSAEPPQRGSHSPALPAVPASGSCRGSGWAGGP